MWFFSFSSQFSSACTVKMQTKTGLKWKEPLTGKKEWSECATFAEHKFYVWAQVSPYRIHTHTRAVRYVMNKDRKKCVRGKRRKMLRWITLDECECYPKSGITAPIQSFPSHHAERFHHVLFWEFPCPAMAVATCSSSPLAGELPKTFPKNLSAWLDRKLCSACPNVDEYMHWKGAKQPAWCMTHSTVRQCA